ncbi:MAG: carboxypeptidase regulatory-like domain-containing protein, partial [Phycisphaerae bacterium]|nr:carboxypeptidase regulatory-like domain-containing protein [Phycisphaerae bacterium]
MRFYNVLLGVLVLSVISQTSSGSEMDPLASFTGPSWGGCLWPGIAQEFEISIDGRIESIRVDANTYAENPPGSLRWYLRDANNLVGANISALPILASGICGFGSSGYTQLFSGASIPVTSGDRLAIELWQRTSVFCWHGGNGYLPGNMFQRGSGSGDFWFVGWGSGWIEYRRVVMVNDGFGPCEVSGKVYDQATGDPIAQADVAVEGGGSTQTNAQGEFALDHQPCELITVTVAKPGYAEGSEIVTLGEYSPAILNIALSPNTDFGVTEVRGGHCTPDKKTYYLNGIPLQQTFTAAVNWEGYTPGLVRWTTPAQSYETPCSGDSVTQSFNMGTGFGEDGVLTLVAVSGDEPPVESASHVANLKVIPLPPGMPTDGWSVQSSNQLKYVRTAEEVSIPTAGVGAGAIPDWVPVFGAEPFEVDLGFKFAPQILGDGTGIGGISELAGSGGAPARFAGVEWKFTVGGKGTWKYNDSQWESGGSLEIGLHGGKKLPPNPRHHIVWVWVVPVPVYWQGNIGVDLGASMGFETWSADPLLPTLNGQYTIKPNGGVRAGVGVADVAAFEGNLGISAPFVLQYPAEPTIKSFSIGASGSLKLVLWKYTREWPILDYKWDVYTGGTDPLADKLRGGLVWSEFSLLPRDYIVPGYATFHPEAPLVSPGWRGERSTESLLQSDIFPYPAIGLVAVGDDGRLVWIYDDPERLSVNGTEVVFSASSNGVWSEPVAIADDGTADFSPVLAELPGGNLLAAWENVDIVLPAEADAETMAVHLEIAVADFDDSTQTWSAQTNLTSNGYLDRSPRLFVGANGHAMLTWVSNAFNDPIGSAAEANTVHYCLWDGVSWSSPGVAASGVSSIVKSAMAFDGSAALYLYSADLDGDLDTVEDMELYAVTFDGATWSAPQRLTNEPDIIDDNPQVVATGGGQFLFAWFRGEQIVTAGSLDLSDLAVAASPGLSAGSLDFRLARGEPGQVTLVWQMASSEAVDLWQTLYDTGLAVWSEPVQLTFNDAMERFMSPAYLENGDLMIAYGKQQVSYTTRILEIGDEQVVLEDVPVPGQSDLCVLMHTAGLDPAVFADDVTLSPANPAIGQTATITAIVRNVGDSPAVGVDVAFYDGDPGGGGTLIDVASHGGVLVGGGEAEVSVEWLVPESSEPRDIHVVVDPDLLLDDVDRDNNTAVLAGVLNPDLFIESVLFQHMGPADGIVTVRVQNGGVITVSDVEVALRSETRDGDLLTTFSISDPIEVGAYRDVSWVWEDAVPFPGGSVEVFAIADEADFVAESDESNNVLAAIFRDDDAVFDCNLNGFIDADDIAGGVSQDCNSNGRPDECDIVVGTSADCNANNIPDECEIGAGTSSDCNTNGILDECEVALLDCNQNQVPDDCDIAGATSDDCNGDGVPDECEIDENSIAPGGPFFCTEDCDPDCNINAVPDECEPDCNGNAVPDDCDITAGTSLDCQPNGIPDECETDCNGNAVADDCDIAVGTSLDCQPNGIPDECEVAILDCNTNGVPDDCDISAGTSLDCQPNGIPDECEVALLDCNLNGVPDDCDIDGSTSDDCNSNGVPDECEIDEHSSAPGGPFFCTADCDPDSNNNGIPDECDIGAGTSNDCNENGTPDECEIDEHSSAPGGPFFCTQDCNPDCNSNGIPDDCDIGAGTSIDCNSNGVPDECEIDKNSSAPGGPFFCTHDCAPDCNNNAIPDDCEPDCNNNGIADECDITSGTSHDCNNNLIPDECELAAPAVLYALEYSWGGAPRLFIIGPSNESLTTIGYLDQKVDQGMGLSVQPLTGTLYAVVQINTGRDGRKGGDPGYLATIDRETAAVTLIGQLSRHLSDIAFRSDGTLYGVADDNDTAPGAIVIVNAFNASITLTEIVRGNGECQSIAFDPQTDLLYHSFRGILERIDVDTGVVTTINPEFLNLQCLAFHPSGAPFLGEGWKGDMHDIDPDTGATTWLGENAEWAAIAGMGFMVPHPDCNANGVLDECDISAGTSQDCNANLVPDECEPDCNNNGFPDECDITFGSSQDCTNNGTPDECEPDCNLNGVADSCDIASGTSTDYTNNGVPDECEQDCNSNGVPDLEDVLFGTSLDCNDNLIPDECELGGPAVLYGLEQEWGNPPDLFILDPSDGSTTSVGQLDQNVSTGVGLSVQPLTETLYAVVETTKGREGRKGGGPRHLATINSQTAAVTLIGQLNRSISDISFRSNGTLHGITDDDDTSPGAVVIVNIANASITPTGIVRGNGKCQSIAFDPQSSLLYHSFGSVLERIDVDTGGVTTINTKIFDFQCLAFHPSGMPFLGESWGDLYAIDPDTGATTWLGNNAEWATIAGMGFVASGGDCNTNGIPDDCDISAGTSHDCNANLIPDECETDCNDNGVADECDVAAGTSADLNGNGVPDECEDCNGNGIPDDLDIAAGTSQDADDNGVPDECEADCNTNGVPDLEDILFGTSQDCNDNLIPDECELAGAVVLYGLEQEWGNPPDLFILNPADGSTTLVGTLDQNVTKGVGLSAQPLTGTLYAVVERTKGGGPRYLAVIDRQTAAATLIGQLNRFLSDISFRSNGALYGITDNDDTSPGAVVIVNIANASITPTGIVRGNGKCQSIAFDPQSGLLYHSFGSILERIDVDTAVVTTINSEFVDFQCLAFHPSGAPFLGEGGKGDMYAIDPDSGATTWLGDNADWTAIAGMGFVAPNGDCNANGIPDECDLSAGTSVDCNANLIPDECETDCNDNGIADECDIAAGSSLDLNGNGVPDECEDCNGNGIPDDLDIAAGTSRDADGNGVPDECEADCNTNGVNDLDDIAFGTSLDCNDNLVPDECELSGAVVLYGLEMSWEPPPRLFIVDPSDGSVTVIGQLDQNLSTGVGLSVQPLTGTLYAVVETIKGRDGRKGGGTQYLAIIDGQTAAVTLISQLNRPIADISFRSNGALYGVTDNADASPGTVVIVNTVDASITPTGIVRGSGKSQSIAFDPQSGLLYHSFGSVLERIDVDTAVVTTIMLEFYDFNCLAFDPSGATFLGEGWSGDLYTIDPDTGVTTWLGENAEWSLITGMGFVAPNWDCNTNGIPDDCDVLAGTSTDCNANLVPDECEPDCNDNGVADQCDISAGTSTDLNDNGVPDECEDCNGNAVPDDLDILGGTSQDLDNNGVPDECEDCNANSIPDSLDLTGGTSQDINGNQIPDECEDCNGNGIPD